MNIDRRRFCGLLVCLPAINDIGFCDNDTGISFFPRSIFYVAPVKSVVDEVDFTRFEKDGFTINFMKPTKEFDVLISFDEEGFSLNTVGRSLHGPLPLICTCELPEQFPVCPVHGGGVCGGDFV